MSAREGGGAVVVAGLGLMGGAIAANLVAAGFAVSGGDPDAAARERASRAGVRVLASLDAHAATAGDAGRKLSSAGQGAAVLLTSLPSAAALDDVVERVVAAPAGLRCLVELSTLAVADKERARGRLAAAGIAMLDAPISGTGAQAVARDLSVYASGDEADWRAVQHVVSAFAERPRFVGGFGNGMRLKLVANLLVAIHNVAAAEALALAEASGLDLAMVVEAVRDGAGNSRVFELRAPLMAHSTYRPATMKLDVWAKDMALIGAEARACGLATPVFDATRSVYAAAQSARGDDDTAAVFEVARRARGGNGDGP